MVSNTCKYAIRAVIYLGLNSENGKKIGIKKISNDLDLPTPFLGKILQTLARHKILSSTKGPNGGFGLGRELEDINLMDIVILIDGDDSFKKCGIGVENCMEKEVPCALHARYAELRDDIKKVFKTTSLEELVEEIRLKGSSIFI